jgi:hypothetical protein
VELEDALKREIGLRQAFPDLVQGEPELPQGQDLQQPGDVVPVVEPVPGGAPPRGREQPDLVVVVQRADGQPRLLRQLSHLPQAHRLGSFLPPPGQIPAATIVKVQPYVA